MKWEPSDILRLVALVGALVLFALGAFMMWQGIAAEGAIDIKSSVVSGSLKTGSAGLFIVFLSFVLVVFVLTSLSKSHATKPSTPARPSKTAGLAKGFFVLLTAFVIAAALAALGYGVGFGLLAAALGFFTLMCGIALLTVMEDE
jgi:hypothetical protein